MRKIAVLALLASFCIVVGKGWHWAKDGFSIRRTWVWEEGKSEPLDEETMRALSQPFKYLSRGHQCYAFASEDGEYVVKLPRTDRYHVAFWLKAIPLSCFHSARVREEENLRSREAFLLESFRISYDELRDQTALLAIHLGKTSSLRGDLIVQDRLRRSYRLPLNSTAFVLQRKKPILMDEFQKAVARGEKERAEKALEAFVSVIAERAAKGILNKDPSFLRNFGFDGKKAFQIDIGSFYRREGIEGVEAYEMSIRETAGPVRDYLKTVDPEMLERFDEKLRRVL